MLTTWIARKAGQEPKYYTFNRLVDIEFSKAIDWRIELAQLGYSIRVKIN